MGTKTVWMHCNQLHSYSFSDSSQNSTWIYLGNLHPHVYLSSVKILSCLPHNLYLLPLGQGYSVLTFFFSVLSWTKMVFLDPMILLWHPFLISSTTLILPLVWYLCFLLNRWFHSSFPAFFCNFLFLLHVFKILRSIFQCHYNKKKVG